MQRCETCGNAYSNCFKVELGNSVHHFDCFECAIHILAPKCDACAVRVIGHGVETGNKVFCCANCARVEGVTQLKDHLEKETDHHQQRG